MQSRKMHLRPFLHLFWNERWYMHDGRMGWPQCYDNFAHVTFKVKLINNNKFTITAEYTQRAALRKLDEEKIDEKMNNK